MPNLTEVEFYNQLAEFFDVMTDWPGRLANELPFLEATFKRYNVHTVLDCACGTGWHAIALKERDYNVAGSDASGVMVARARANAIKEQVAIPFYVAQFKDLSEVFADQFDALICLGNSFPHVLIEDDALASLASMRQRVHAGGILVLQNLNYDKRWKNKPRWFAANSGALDGRETLVWRFADYGDSLITFNIALFQKASGGGWSVQVQSTLQRPFQSEELLQLLKRAGFSSSERYGNLKGETFDPAQSDDLVIVATAGT